MSNELRLYSSLVKLKTIEIIKNISQRIWFFFSIYHWCSQTTKVTEYLLKDVKLCGYNLEGMGFDGCKFVVLLNV
jgi:hypothetical protein